MKIKCLIIDDEPIARDVIRAHLEKLDDFEIVQEHENALEALSFLKQNRIDLIFLDINSASKKTPVFSIFVTNSHSLRSR